MMFVTLILALLVSLGYPDQKSITEVVHAREDLIKLNKCGEFCELFIFWDKII